MMLFVRYKTSMAEFPHDVVVRNGYAEVLKEKGLLDEALAEYKTTMAEFPHDVFARSAFLSLLILMNNFEDASNYIFKGVPFTSADWVNYHITAIYHMKIGNINDAIQMLEYGIEKSPLIKDKSYFARGLAFAKNQATTI